MLFVGKMNRTGAMGTPIGDDWSGQVNCCWPSPGQSFLVLSPMGLMTIFFCLITLGVMQFSCPKIVALRGDIYTKERRKI
jgi:hypothetical protein